MCSNDRDEVAPSLTERSSRATAACA
jgi:hypothetical protein